MEKIGLTNGSVRLLRIITIVGAGAAALIAVVTIMWQLFSIASSVTTQAQTNERFLQRLALAETAMQALQLTVNGHELRLTSLRAELDAQRVVESGFQTEMRGSISRVTEILTDVRLAVGVTRTHK